MLKSKKLIIILIMTLIMLTPNVVRAEGKTLSKIDVTVPKPIIGKIPASVSDVSVSADGSISLEPKEVIWYISTNDGYKEIEDKNETFKANKRYAVSVLYKRQNQYEIPKVEGIVSDEFELKINDIELNSQDVFVFNVGSTGGEDYENDGVFYEFGVPEVEKNISYIDITIPKPEIGKKQFGLEDVIIEIDKNEKLEVLLIDWYKYNPETKKYELDTTIPSEKLKGFYDGASSEVFDEFKIKEFKEGDKYIIDIMYNRPYKYGYSTELVVKVNGKEINTNNIDEFNPGSVGDSEGKWDSVKYEFDELKQTIVSNEENEEIKEDKKEEVKKDETTVPGVIPHAGGTFVIIITILLILIMLIYLVYKRKDLKNI